MSEKENKAFRELYKLAKKTNKQVRELKRNSDKKNPVDMDVLKTTKAMFYEKAIEIFKKYKEEEE